MKTLGGYLPVLRWGAGLIFLTAPLPAHAQETGMGMEMDNEIFHYSRLELDAARTPGPTLGRWHGNGWIGTDFDRLWWSTEGEVVEGSLEGAEATMLYGRYFRRFWDVVVGYRQDFQPTTQGYLTVGLMGLAPYWFEVGLFGFVSDRGKPSLRAEAETDLHLTQRWVLTMGGEVDWLITDDDELDIGAGVARLEMGIRSRWEIRRKLAPYVDLLLARESDPRLPDAGASETEGLRFGVGLRLIY